MMPARVWSVRDAAMVAIVLADSRKAPVAVIHNTKVSLVDPREFAFTHEEDEVSYVDSIHTQLVKELS